MDGVEEAFLLFCQLLQLVGEILSEFQLSCLKVVDCRVERLGQLISEIGGETEAGVVLNDLLLDEARWKVRQVAVAALYGSTLEVGVEPAVAGDLGVDEARSPSLLMAAVAEEEALQVMGQLLIVHCWTRSDLEDVLNPVEQVLRDQGVVASVEQLALVDGESRVVRITEDAVDAVHGERALSLPTSERLSAESHILGCLRDVAQGVLACGVQLENRADERRSAVIDCHGVDLSSVDVLAHVQVADGRAPDGSAVARLMGHLHFDVFAVATVLKVVHGVRDRLHELGLERVAEVFLCRDDLDPEPAKVLARQDCVLDVAEGAGTRIDEDVVDLGVLSQVGQEPPKLGALVNGLSAATGFDKHLLNIDAETGGLAVALLALSSDGVAVGRDIHGRVRLLHARYPQIVHSDLSISGRFVRPRLTARRSGAPVAAHPELLLRCDGRAMRKR